MEHETELNGIVREASRAIFNFGSRDVRRA